LPGERPLRLLAGPQPVALAVATTRLQEWHVPECPAVDGSSARQTSFDGPFPMCIDPSKSYTAEMVTSMGTMTIALDSAAAPATVNNFVCLARYKYYDSLIFHRIIQGFMCQGGCPEGSGRQWCWASAAVLAVRQGCCRARRCRCAWEGRNRPRRSAERRCGYSVGDHHREWPRL